MAKVNAKAEKFIREKLIPFVLREQGNGFAMSTWRSIVKSKNVEELCFDGVDRTKVPACGTVACLGGSVQILAGTRSDEPIKLGAILGISPHQASALFYKWDTGEEETGYHWPADLAKKFYNAITPLAKAKVAVSLLKRVIRTGGACLNPTVNLNPTVKE